MESRGKGPVWGRQESPCLCGFLWLGVSLAAAHLLLRTPSFLCLSFPPSQGEEEDGDEDDEAEGPTGKRAAEDDEVTWLPSPGSGGVDRGWCSGRRVLGTSLLGDSRRRTFELRGVALILSSGWGGSLSILPQANCKGPAHFSTWTTYRLLSLNGLKKTSVKVLLVCQNTLWPRAEIKSGPGFCRCTAGR